MRLTGLTLIPDGLGVWHNDTLPDDAFDIAQANQILDEAGYQDTDGDGIREMPDGSQPLVFRLYWPNDVITAPRMAELLGQSWGQIGVQTEEPQTVDPDALIALCCPGFDYDIILWSWFSDPDPNFIIPYYPQAAQAYRTDRFRGWLDDQPRLALEDVSSLVRIQPVP